MQVDILQVHFVRKILCLELKHVAAWGCADSIFFWSFPEFRYHFNKKIPNTNWVCLHFISLQWHQMSAMLLQITDTTTTVRLASQRTCIAEWGFISWHSCHAWLSWAIGQLQSWAHFTSIIKCGMKLLIHFQYSTFSPILGVWLLIQDGINANPCQWKRPQHAMSSAKWYDKQMLVLQQTL